MTAATEFEHGSDGRFPAPFALAISVPLNTLLGLLGYLPYIHSVFLANGIAGHLDWSHPTQQFRDGVWPVLLFLLVPGRRSSPPRCSAIAPS